MRLIVEADGGSRGNPGPAAYGALVRDADSGEVLVEVSEAIGVATNNVAEYRGVVAGLREAHTIDPDATVEARLDSKLIVEQMSGRWKIKNSDLKPLALEARRIFPADRVTFTWVPREENTHADRLVNEALDGESSRADIAVAAAPAISADDIGASGAGARDRPAGDVGASGLLARAAGRGGATGANLYLVRHGRTADTVARLFTGGSTVGAPLDEVGQQQAQAAAGMLAQSGAVTVVASPMLRAQQTAQPIAARLGVTVVTDPEWRELEFGAWEGRPIDEVIATTPGPAAAWRESASVPAPAGESIADMAKRVRAARDRLLGAHPGQSVVAVTHSMPIRSLVVDVLGAPLEAVHQLRPSTGSMTEIRVTDDGFVVAGFSTAP